MGCLPYVLERLKVRASEIDKAGCASPFNEVAQFFNRLLKKVVKQLRKDLSLAAITYVDIYTAKYSLITYPNKYGIKQTLRTCCGHGGKYNYNKNIGCGTKLNIHGKQVLVGKACKDPSIYVNWDGVHFTQAANKLIFDQIVGGSLADPPHPLNMACHKN